MTHWLVVTSAANFRHDRDVLGFTNQGLPIRYRKSLRRMSVGDRVVYYIMGIQKFGATATITGDYFEDATRLWTDRDETWPARRPSRRDIVLKDEELLDARRLVSGLSFVANKNAWGASFQGSIREIPEEDFAFIESRMRNASGRRLDPEQTMTNDELQNQDLDEVNEEAAGAEAMTEGADEGDLEVDLQAPGIIIEKNDRSLAEFHRWYKSGRLIIDPEWQRQYVWDRRRASKLIESILIDVPIPVIYLAKNVEGKYEVIDGLQRLTSVFRYFDGEYSLNGLEIVRGLNKKYYKELPEKEQNKLNDYTLRTFELAEKTPKDLMFLIFERLNTGGIALNDMEIRNSLFRGALNQLIKDLATDPNFKDALNQPKLERRMQDRALVLRFLAFYERTHLKLRNGLKRFLNEFLETYRNPLPSKIREFEDQFRKSMKAAATIFGDNAFRLRREWKDGTVATGEWATRPNAAVFQVISTSFTRYDIGQLTRSSDAIFEEYLDLITTDEKWRDYVRRATGETARIEYVFETWNDRLKSTLQGVEANDTVRAFSKQLKRELFEQSHTCQLCHQEIKLLNDAVLDHDKHYWRGGRTIPDNARLAHRRCNAERGGA